MNSKTILLLLVVALVAGSIYYLESMKATPSGAPAAQVKVIEENVSNDFLPSEGYVPSEEVVAAKSLEYQPAPELAGIHAFINSSSFTLKDLRGKVVLIDFWTYSCINCIRTQPYLNAWHDTYAEDGLVIVGVHTPEFEFEKDTQNVKGAVADAEIKYPVVQDNDYATWRAFSNRWWPRKFLIDIDGFIRYDHIGEGKYDETEAKIKELLMERSERFGMELNEQKESTPVNVDVAGAVGTPEIYFGYKFTRGNFGSPEGLKPEQVNSYAVPDVIDPNKAYLTGEWLNKADYSELVSNEGSILLYYGAKKVNIVASSAEEAELRIFLDGQPITEEFRTDDFLVGEERLYNIVSATEAGAHALEIRSATPGFRIYTFTFG